MIRFLPKMISRQWTYIVCAVLIIIISILWVLLAAPYLNKIPVHFSYAANILSIDNLYDERTNKFQGEHISKTTFSYDVTKILNHDYVIENKFEVRKLNDDPIISITRTYLINPYTWQHTTGFGIQNRSGYLFGPQYANKSNYLYWHINYNKEVILKFINKERMNGLLVYHYQAQFSADQSKDLTYLPGVPDKRGVKTDVNLNVWIEPISGWLVQYTENSIAYYYDKKTESIISPWNKFSNRYTVSSVKEQVKIANHLKMKILMVDYGIPGLFLFSAIIFFLLGFNVKIISKTYIYKLNNTWDKYEESVLHYGVLLTILIFSIITIYYFLFFSITPGMYTIGISQWSNNTDLKNTVAGFKAGLTSSGYKEGVNIKYIDNNPNANIENQIHVIQSYIKMDVDLLFVLTTPGTLVAKGITASTPIVFTSVIYPKKTDIISSMQASQHNLVGISNYISPAKQFNAFEKIYPNSKVIAFVHRKGDPDSDIQYREYQQLFAYRGIQIIDMPAIDLDDLKQQLSRKDLSYDVLISACDTLIQGGGGEVVANYCNTNKIANYSCDKDSVVNGALLGLVADPYETGYMAGKQAALILDGARPAWLHTESPNQGKLIINEQSAIKLGIDIPNTLKQSAVIIHGNKQ